MAVAVGKVQYNLPSAAFYHDDLASVKEPNPGSACRQLPCAFCLRPSGLTWDDGNSCCSQCWQRRSVGKAATCCQCGLPLGQIAYLEPGGSNMLHGECAAKVRSRAREQSNKPNEREQFGIGWTTASSVSDSLVAASKLALPTSAEAGDSSQCSGQFFAVEFDESNNTFQITKADSPEAVVVLPYLSIALQARRQEGREPYFSLDPVPASKTSKTSKSEQKVQAKKFAPEWLAATSVGDVLFQADYLLKELSMGARQQPCLGMRSALDRNAAAWEEGSWTAREWFVVKSAQVSATSNGRLVPHVEMGVEVREQVENADGILEDARVTRPDHPLAIYAKQFSKNFDLLAERNSAIFHLRELAKASVLAKFLLSRDDAKIESDWFELFETTALKTKLLQLPWQIPQLWQEGGLALEEGEEGGEAGGVGGEKVVDGILSTPKSQLRSGVYGGVQFGLERFELPLARGLSIQSSLLPTLRPRAPLKSATDHAQKVNEGLHGGRQRPDLEALSYMTPLTMENLGLAGDQIGDVAIGGEPGPTPAYPADVLIKDMRAIVRTAMTGGVVPGAAAPTGAAAATSPADNIARLRSLGYPNRAARGPTVGHFRSLPRAPAIDDQRLMGVDLGLDAFNLSELSGEAATKTGDARLLMGTSLIELVKGESTDVDFALRPLLQMIFDPAFSDRIASESDRIRLSSSSLEYLDKLSGLLEGEQQEQTKRLERFSDPSFSTAALPTCFPKSWATAAASSLWQSDLGQHLTCEPLEDEGACRDLLRLVKSSEPDFDCCTDDGLRWRIYRNGLSEVRTLQLPQLAEEIVGCYTLGSHSNNLEMRGSETLAKAILVAAPNPEKSGTGLSLLLRAKGGGVALVGEAASGVCWTEEPNALAAAKRVAKTLASVDLEVSSSTSQLLAVAAVREHFEFLVKLEKPGTSGSKSPETLETAGTHADVVVRSLFNWLRQQAGHPPTSLYRSPSKQQPTAKRATTQSGEDDKDGDDDRLRSALQTGEDSGRDKLASLINAGTSFANDREVVLAAVRQDGHALRLASAELRDDFEVVAMAAQQNPLALRFASERLRSDLSIARRAVSKDPEALGVLPTELRSNVELVELARSISPAALKFATLEGLGGPGQLLGKLLETPTLLASLPPEIAGDTTLLLQAFDRTPLVLQHAPAALRGDLDFIQGVLARNPYALKFASPALQSNAELLDLVCQKDPRALKFASPGAARSAKLRASSAAASSCLCSSSPSSSSSSSGAAGRAATTAATAAGGAEATTADASSSTSSSSSSSAVPFSTSSSLVVCPQNHELICLRSRAEVHFACDHCETTVPRQSSVFTCSTCCFDLCKPCFEEEELLRGHGLGTAPKKKDGP